ncbi:hypothetical protein EIKCOROL_00601 [Eikenella corrodens ATCC 23834]|uniref:Uncharacterized protein n=1 Tax=Eikenella corrodens ATCC 23834 TaxID=546274 RepID=C0DTC4_EIKCO|nr:hypothetical protein EIKCOROL_00601 [Eikenella corrodens ATCC 23834]
MQYHSCFPLSVCLPVWQFQVAFRLWQRLPENITRPQTPQ